MDRHVEAVAHDDVAAGHVEVARYGRERREGLGRRDAVGLLVDGQAPLDAGALRAAVHAGRSPDVLGVDPADVGHALGRPLQRTLLERVEAVAPIVDEIVVEQVLLDDDVLEGQRHGAVGARTDAQPHVGLGAEPRERRVDDDELRAQLHEVDDPVTQEAVGVRTQRLVAPDDDDFGQLPVGVEVAQRMQLRAVEDGLLAALHGRGGRARQVARRAGEEAQGEVRAAEAGVAQKRDLPDGVAARALHGDDRFGAVVGPDGAHLRLDLVVGLVPRDALPLVLAALAGTAHRVLHAVGVVDGLGHVEAAHAKAPVVIGRLRVAFDLDELALLVGVEQERAAVVAAGPRPVRRARDGQVALLVAPFLLVDLRVRLIGHERCERHKAFPLLGQIIALSCRGRGKAHVPLCLLSPTLFDSPHNLRPLGHGQSGPKATRS